MRRERRVSVTSPLVTLQPKLPPLCACLPPSITFVRRPLLSRAAIRERIAERIHHLRRRFAARGAIPEAD
jgi:hypothetical protein